MNSKRQSRLIGAAALIAMFITASACSDEQVRVTALRTNDAPRIGLGFIENRDIRYSPFSSKNFNDMLVFELMQSGYRVGDLDFDALLDGRAKIAPWQQEPAAEASSNEQSGEQADTNEAGYDVEKQPNETIVAEADGDGPVDENSMAETETASEPAEKEETAYAESVLGSTERSQTVAKNEALKKQIQARDGTYDLLPRRLRTIAGELEPRQRQIHPRNRRLKDREIAAMAQAHRLDYYIQGAISREETGLLLESEENTIVFLEVFTPAGERVAAINMSIDNETLKRASFLKEVSAEIVTAFAAEIGR